MKYPADVVAWDVGVWGRWKGRVEKELRRIEERREARECAAVAERGRRVAQALSAGVVADSSECSVDECGPFYRARSFAINRRVHVAGRMRLRAAIRG